MINEKQQKEKYVGLIMMPKSPSEKISESHVPKRILLQLVV